MAQRSASDILYDKLKADFASLATENGVAAHMILINTQLAELNQHLVVIEAALAEKKKAVKTPKAATAATTPAAAAVAGKASPKPPANARAYFLNQYKVDEAYRAKHLTADIQKIIDADETCTKKEKGSPGRFTAEATTIWKSYSTTNKTLVDAVKKEYEDMKSTLQAVNPEPKVAAEPVDDL